MKNKSLAKKIMQGLILSFTLSIIYSQAVGKNESNKVFNPILPKVNNDPIIFAYYANWDVYKTINKITPYTFGNNNDMGYKLARVNSVAYAFLEVKPDGTIYFTDTWSDLSAKSDIDVQFCKQNPVICNGATSDKFNYGNFDAFANSDKTNGITNKLIAVGGASHDDSIIAAMNNPTNFIQSLKTIAATYPITGIDIDYEPVGGMPAQYYASFLNLLKTIRTTMGSKFLITYTIIPNQDYINAFGRDNWLKLANYVDYINIMGYDMFGAFSNPAITGLHSTLYTMPDTGSANYSDNKAISTLTANGITTNKIILGVPAYGRTVSNVSNNGLGQKFTQSYPGDLDYDPSHPCTVVIGQANTCSGTLTYSSIINNNYTINNVEDKDNNLVGAYSNFTTSDYGLAFTSYDSPDSVTAKVNYANKYNLAGIMMWDISYDTFAVDSSQTPNNYSLLNAIDKAYGITPRPFTPTKTLQIQLQLTSNTQQSGTTDQITFIKQPEGAYYAFPSISTGTFQMWCSSDIASATCLSSSILNNLGYAKVKVQVSPGSDVSKAWVCPSNSPGFNTDATITLVKGYQNLQVNSTYRSCSYSHN